MDNITMKTKSFPKLKSFECLTSNSSPMESPSQLKESKSNQNTKRNQSFKKNKDGDGKKAANRGGKTLTGQSNSGHSESNNADQKSINEILPQVNHHQSQSLNLFNTQPEQTSRILEQTKHSDRLLQMTHNDLKKKYQDLSFRYQQLEILFKESEVANHTLKRELQVLKHSIALQEPKSINEYEKSDIISGLQSQVLNLKMENSRLVGLLGSDRNDKTELEAYPSFVHNSKLPTFENDEEFFKSVSSRYHASMSPFERNGSPNRQHKHINDKRRTSPTNDWLINSDQQDSKLAKHLTLSNLKHINSVDNKFQKSPNTVWPLSASSDFSNMNRMRSPSPLQERLDRILKVESPQQFAVDNSYISSPSPVRSIPPTKDMEKPNDTNWSPTHSPEPTYDDYRSSILSSPLIARSESPSLSERKVFRENLRHYSEEVNHNAEPDLSLKGGSSSISRAIQNDGRSVDLKFVADKSAEGKGSNQSSPKLPSFEKFLKECSRDTSPVQMKDTNGTIVKNLGEPAQTQPAQYLHHIIRSESKELHVTANVPKNGKDKTEESQNSVMDNTATLWREIKQCRGTNDSLPTRGRTGFRDTQSSNYTNVIRVDGENRDRTKSNKEEHLVEDERVALEEELLAQYSRLRQLERMHQSLVRMTHESTIQYE
ncbi:hypothetical protein BC833DRAFT_586990 [Globomyces pollinis-pini]|nr:hypothetical protein BC833DRAFT_586990 [Globomyces pollinis-pini]